MKYLLLILLWVFWCALHSGMIAAPVTEYVKKRLGNRYRFYRLFYNSLALVTLLPPVYYSILLEGTPVFRWHGALVLLQCFLLIAGLVLFIAGAKHYNISQFLGIRQVRTGEINPTLSEDDAFDMTGILCAIRHPWYAAGIMVVWARDLSLSTVLTNLVITAYFIVGSILEERKLVREFGSTYIEYQQHVSMFFPYMWLKAKIAQRFDR
ncbi:MAG TPA: NnrU family protein [Syntrophorhabdales bacterium]|nr:NnrU family protein [Syntrophorhabdales bacterium]